ncbi:hypothetical protein ACS0TY_027873 [Phlomoides rotata]
MGGIFSIFWNVFDCVLGEAGKPGKVGSRPSNALMMVPLEAGILDLLSRNSLTNGATNDFKLMRGITTQTGTTAAIPNFGSSAKIFAPYTLFKGKAALSADPLLPTFSKLESGNYRVERRGVIMLTFWPAIGERKYDWDKRQRLELWSLGIQMIHVNSSMTHQCYQDFSYLISRNYNLQQRRSNVVNNVLKTNDRFTVPVTPAEFAVMRTAFTICHHL